MRTILLALLLGFISINVSTAEAHQEAAVQAAPCAAGVCHQPVRNTARAIVAAPVRIVQGAACAAKNVACNVKSRVKSRVACRQARRARFFRSWGCCK